MRLPIHAALHWPHTLPAAFVSTELAGKDLQFFEPEQARYPMLWIARQAINQGEAACIAYNAANEVAVTSFDHHMLRFVDIAQVVAGTLDKGWNLPVKSFEDIFNIDKTARQIAAQLVERISA